MSSAEILKFQASFETLQEWGHQYPLGSSLYLDPSFSTPGRSLLSRRNLLSGGSARRPRSNLLTERSPAIPRRSLFGDEDRGAPAATGTSAAAVITTAAAGTPAAAGVPAAAAGTPAAAGVPAAAAAAEVQSGDFRIPQDRVPQDDDDTASIASTSAFNKWAEDLQAVKTIQELGALRKNALKTKGTRCPFCRSSFASRRSKDSHIKIDTRCRLIVQCLKTLCSTSTEAEEEPLPDLQGAEEDQIIPELLSILPLPTPSNRSVTSEVPSQSGPNEPGKAKLSFHLLKG